MNHFFALLLLFFPSILGFTRIGQSKQLILTSVSSNGNDDEVRNFEINDTDEDISGVIPYQNRTLAWTKRYRMLVPYESARLTAMRLGLRSKDDWDDIREFGRAFHGAHLVSRPDIMYAKEWISWDEFLGVMRPYREAKAMIQSLGIESMEQYIAFVKEDIKRAESLRIPAKPKIYYRDKGWQGGAAFFDGK
jgi:hypothetical protein